MTTYIDSSALVAVYVPEQFSAAARARVSASQQVPFTELHRLEVTNAFGLLLGRGLLTEAEHGAVLAQLQDDVTARRLNAVAPDWADVFRSAGDLSGRHTPRVLTRSLDVLHVALAKVLACRTFVSADDRQLALARLAGLRAIDIKPKRKAKRVRPISVRRPRGPGRDS